MATRDRDPEEVQKIFRTAVKLHTSEERKAYLDEECGDDPHLLETIVALLRECTESDSTEITFVPGTMLAERYRIVSLLGRGGMGEVYRADDLKLDQPVALKFLREALAGDQSLLKALYNEVRQARQVSHRHVCRVYDIGEAEGLHFLSMEFIEGEDLGALLKRVGRLPEDKAIELARQLCSGLQAVHQEGLLHLDLKPGNLMIDGRGDLRVTDFGVARPASEAKAEKRIAGTPPYMAPEQLLDGRASQRSDLYAVGLILYEMFTGQPMHRARTSEEMIAWHKSREASRRRTLEPPHRLEPAVEDLILRCTATDPAERPESVGQILAVLEELGTSPMSRGRSEERESDAALPPEELKRSDVMIAYAPVDNKPLVAGRPGWIAQFQDHLQVRLEQLSGESVKIWRDEAPRSEELDEELLRYLPSAKTMVSVMSPPFLRTPLCLRQLEAFWHSAERSGTLRVSDKTRMLKVVKTPVPSGVAPPEVERLMANLAGFEFFETDQESGRVLPYDETFGEKAMQRYFEKVYDLAYEIREVLLALGGSGSAGGDRSSPGKTVYLAETTSDLQPERDMLKRELLENGHRVVPELPLPFSGVNLEKEARLLLEESDFAVHLVGARYGMVPEDTQASVVELQNRLAAERAANGELKRFIWMPRGIEPRDERQAAFVRALIEDPEAHRGGEVVQDAMENFKEMLLASLSPPSEEEKAAVAAPEGRDGVSTIYLIYDRRDEETIEPLEDLLFELGFEVTTPSFEGDENEIGRIHRHNLQHCDAALVFYGAVGKPWVDMKLMDIAQAPGYGRTKEMLAKAVYVAPSDDRRKARFRTHLAEVIRGATMEIDAAVLEPFTSPLRRQALGR